MNNGIRQKGDSNLKVASHPSSFILHPFVVKVGGSLFDLPNLGTRLVNWLVTLACREILLVPGGGAAADVVRAADRCHHLGEQPSHWLALRALSLNAHLLAVLLPRFSSAQVVEEIGACTGAWQNGFLPILDPLSFARQDEDRNGHLPHCWDVTSDSLAARVALVVQARELVLLKSVTIPPEITWEEAGHRGFVDAAFAGVVGQELKVKAVNLRQEG
jgi:aspartokinase-like uncharacterized kinase